MSGEFLTNCVGTPLSASEFRLAAPLWYDSSVYGVIVVDAGFVGGTSTPRPLWGIYPPIARYLPAALVHDKLYQSPGGFSRQDCDAILLEAMAACGVNWFNRRMIWWHVRHYGWIPWNNHRKHDKESAQ